MGRSRVIAQHNLRRTLELLEVSDGYGQSSTSMPIPVVTPRWGSADRHHTPWTSIRRPRRDGLDDDDDLLGGSILCKPSGSLRPT